VRTIIPAARSAKPLMSQIVSEDSARPVRAGHTAERIGYFTDAVFAIAMTLLVIEIPRPDAADFSAGGRGSKTEAFRGLWHFLLAQRAAFFAYVLAFYILWIVWRRTTRSWIRSAACPRG